MLPVSHQRVAQLQFADADLQFIHRIQHTVGSQGRGIFIMCDLIGIVDRTHALFTNEQVGFIAQLIFADNRLDRIDDV